MINSFLFITQMHKHPLFLPFVLPCLLFILFYIYRLHAFKPLFVTALAVGIADTIAYRVLKQNFPRLRPFEKIRRLRSGFVKWGRPTVRAFLRIMRRMFGPAPWFWRGTFRAFVICFTL